MVGQVSRRTQALVVVALAAAVPRLIVLAIERETILEQFVEKSDRFARTLATSGTFGFIPGVPSAYTQPLYAFFLAGLYWPLERSWAVVGIAQTLVAVGTALLVFEIGRRLRSVGFGVLAALIATLHPYLVWHDVHVNRELLDGFLLALLTLLALVAYERRSPLLGIAAGAVAGLAILGNSRLVLLPLLVGAYVAWPLRTRRQGVLAALAVVVAAGAVVGPWAIRNKAEIGCFAITTDARALWKANNANTYGVLAKGQWIDDVPELPGVPPWPEKAADQALRTGKPVTVDECAQMSFYQDEVFDFWRDHPGEKAKLAAQATALLWRPTLTVEADDPGRGGFAGTVRETAEPAYMLVVYALAIAGCFLAPRRFLALALLLMVYNTLMAMVFAGTLRYRVPWDFLLALLAALALERAWAWARDRGYLPARVSEAR
jgi:4-amino-4-deoxy-L-arabinose transferase-like glycosyltransferase